MKRIFTLILALSLLALTACSGGGTGETDSLTPEERTQRFVTAPMPAARRTTNTTASSAPRMTTRRI